MLLETPAATSVFRGILKLSFNVFFICFEEFLSSIVDYSNSFVNNMVVVMVVVMETGEKLSNSDEKYDNLV